MLGRLERNFVEKQVDEMMKYLDYIECTEQIQNRLHSYDQVGYGLTYLIKKTREGLKHEKI